MSITPYNGIIEIPVEYKHIAIMSKCKNNQERRFMSWRKTKMEYIYSKNY